MLGVQRPSVSLTAGILRKANFLDYRAGRVTIVDRSGLERTACECYGTIQAQLNDIFGPTELVAERLSDKNQRVCQPSNRRPPISLR
jgi:hypothetical protein